VNRQQLEHIIRAAGDVIIEDEIIVVGSQALLGAEADGLPRSVLVSREADVMARVDPDGAKALRINGAIGELSRFDSTHGYYAQGVELSLLRLPLGWFERCTVVENENTRGVRGYCLELHDICVSKLLAGREKDSDYVGALLRSGHAKPETLIERFAQTEMSEQERDRVATTLVRFRRPVRRSEFRRALRRVGEGGSPGS
jgi:hypothetical protein